MKPAERVRVEELLQDQSLSYRAISRELGVSDWYVRKIARELDGDPRPMRQHPPRHNELPSEDVSPLIGWLVSGGFVLGTVLQGQASRGTG